NHILGRFREDRESFLARPQILLGLFSRRDVGGHAERAGVATAFQDWTGGNSGPDHYAVLALQSQIVLFRQAAAAAGQRIANGFSIAFIDEFENVAANQLVERVAEHVAHPRIREAYTIIFVDRPDPFLGDIEDLLIRVGTGLVSHAGIRKYKTGSPRYGHQCVERWP